MNGFRNLSETEAQSWTALMADGVIFVWFWKAMAPGWSLVPNDVGPERLNSIFIGLVILTVVLHASIAAIFRVRRRADDADEVGFDERDLDAQSFGARIAYTMLYLGIGAIIVAVGMGYSMPDTVGGPFRIETLVHVIFVLVLLCYAVDLLRNVAMILRYRSI